MLLGLQQSQCRANMVCGVVDGYMYRTKMQRITVFLRVVGSKLG